MIRDIWTSGRRAATCKWEGLGFVHDLVAARFRRLKNVFGAVVAQKLDASNNDETGFFGVGKYFFLYLTAKVLSVKGTNISRSPQVPRFC